MSSSEEKYLNTKRKRAKNYTEQEEMLLVELIEKRKSFIENKKSDAVIWKQKQEAWCKIEKEFEAIIGTHRHWKALRDKYDMLKRKSKSDMAMQKSETGGVACTAVSTVSAKIAAMLGDSVTDFKNTNDSDFVLNESNECIDLDNSIENINLDQMYNKDFRKETGCTVNKADWPSWMPLTWKQTKSNELDVNSKRKKPNLDEEKIELIRLQQTFFRDENARAQEKHEQEILTLKIKNEILQLELAAKKKM